MTHVLYENKCFQNQSKSLRNNLDVLPEGFHQHKTQAILSVLSTYMNKQGSSWDDCKRPNAVSNS
jgi:hypothetical protein